MDEATFARPLRGGPSGVKPIGRRDREQTDVAAVFKAYCDDIHVTLAKCGLTLTELSTHLQGQLVAVHPAYDVTFDGFAAPGARQRARRGRHGRSSR